jgi:hypothetical protein
VRVYIVGLCCVGLSYVYGLVIIETLRTVPFETCDVA